MGDINFSSHYFKADSENVWFRTPLYLLQIIFLLSGLLILRYYFRRRRFFALGNKLPGPKPLPLVGNAFYFPLDKETKLDLLGMLNHLNNKYGLARFWLGHQLHVIACTPEDAKTFYSSPDLLDRSDTFQLLLEPVFGSGLPTANGTKWKEAKQLLEPLLTYKFLIKPASVYEQKSDTLIRTLDKKIGSTFSIYQEVAKCICDISCEIFSGCSLNIQEEDSILHEDFELVGKYALQRFLSHWLHVDLLFRLSKTGRKYFQALKNIDRFIKHYCEMYAPFYQEDVLNIMDNEELSEIRRIMSYGINKATDQDMKDYYLSTVGASVDTTGTTISFALMLLGKHPDIQQKLYEEICPAAENGFDDNELRKLGYLDRVIKETFRLFTPIPMSSRKANEDILFGEHLVPKGAAVSLNLFAIHRDPEQYENANSFDPDHFLPENVAKRHPYSFIPFGMGKRKCVGGNFAYIVIRLILAKILYNYRVECDMGLEDIEVRFYIATKAKKLNYPIRLFRR